MGSSQSKQDSDIISNDLVKCNTETDTNSVDKHSVCMEAGSCKAGVLNDSTTIEIKVENNIQPQLSLDSGYIELNTLVKEASCCLNKEGFYDYFVSVYRNSNIQYTYYMKACCYVKITGDSEFSKSFKCRGSFPFGIGTIDVVQLDDSREKRDSGKKYTVFELVSTDGDIIPVKFSKVPYTGPVFK